MIPSHNPVAIKLMVPVSHFFHNVQKGVLYEKSNLNLSWYWFAFLFSWSITIDPKGSAATGALPNGYLPSSEELEQLQLLTPLADRILSNASKRSSDEAQPIDDEAIIESLKELLIQQFGADASLYYGEVDEGTQNDESATTTRTVVTSSRINGLTVWHNGQVKKSWGPWWVKYTFMDGITYRDTVTSKDSMLYCTKIA